MIRYVLQRITLMLVTFFIIMFACFALIRMLPLPVLDPGDVHGQIAQLRREAMGYDKPIIQQFIIFLKNLFTKWDWGVSDKLYLGQDVWALFVDKLPATILTNLYSILFAIPIGITLGIVAALHKNSGLDHFLSTSTMIFISVPSFVYASLVQYFLCFKLGWFPLIMKTGRNFLDRKSVV